MAIIKIFLSFCPRKEIYYLLFFNCTFLFIFLILPDDAGNILNQVILFAMIKMYRLQTNRRMWKFDYNQDMKQECLLKEDSRFI